MKKSKFSESQIIKALKENEQGRKTDDLCREMGIHKGTFYNWRKKYSGMDASQLKRLKELEDENTRLKKMYAELSLDNVMLKRCAVKKVVSPVAKREMCLHLIQTYEQSIRRVCLVLAFCRSMWYYQSSRNDQPVIDKLSELAEQLPTRGFDTYYGRIRQQGYEWSRNKVLRIYRLMKLKMRRKHKKRLPTRFKESLNVPLNPNHTWSMDFMSDALTDA